jgi:hypothetical protein
MLYQNCKIYLRYFSCLNINNYRKIYLLRQTYILSCCSFRQMEDTIHLADYIVLVIQSKVQIKITKCLILEQMTQMAQQTHNNLRVHQMYRIENLFSLYHLFFYQHYLWLYFYTHASSFQRVRYVLLRNHVYIRYHFMYLVFQLLHTHFQTKYMEFRQLAN